MLKYSTLLNDVGATILAIGTTLFLFAFFSNDYIAILASIRIGTVMVAVFNFLMGIFFVVTEEVLERNRE